MNSSDISRIFRTPPRLETQRLVLRMIGREDLCDMFDYSSREEVTRYLLWSPHPSIAYTRGYIRAVCKHYRVGDFYDWAIVSKDDSHMIGTIGFVKIDTQNRVGEIGYVVNPKYAGQGFATEAGRLVLDFGFEQLGLNRIEARYMAENTASRRVMEKIGMTYEGTARSLMFVKGKYRDISICAITREDYLSSRSSHSSNYSSKTSKTSKTSKASQKL